MNKSIVKIKEIILLYLKKRLKNVVITKSLSAYLDNLAFKKEEQSIKKAYSKLSNDKNFSYQTPFLEVKLIKLLSDLINAKKILEIGTFRGFTSGYLALSPTVETIFTCELDEKNTVLAQQLWKSLKINHKITPLVGLAKENLQILINKKMVFDLIYIDANKNQYPDYFDLSLQLIRKEGLILIDNTLWAGLVAEKNTSYSHAKIIDKLNKKIAKNPHFESIILPAWDGLTIVKVNKS